MNLVKRRSRSSLAGPGGGDEKRLAAWGDRVGCRTVVLVVHEHQVKCCVRGSIRFWSASKSIHIFPYFSRNPLSHSIRGLQFLDHHFPIFKIKKRLFGFIWLHWRSRGRHQICRRMSQLHFSSPEMQPMVAWEMKMLKSIAFSWT